MVPPMRSNRSSTAPASSTGNDSSDTTAVMSMAQMVMGMRINERPRVRICRMVVM